MPFASKSQQRWMFLHHPKMAKEWASETDFKNLPEKKKKTKYRPKEQTGGVYSNQQEIDIANAQAKRLSKKWGTMNPEEAYVAKNIGDPLVPFVGKPSSNPYQRNLARLPSNFDINQLQSYGDMYWYENNSGDIVDVDPSSIPGTKVTPNLLAKRRRGGYHKMQLAGQFTPNDDSKYNWEQFSNQQTPTTPFDKGTPLWDEQPEDIIPAIPTLRQKPVRKPWDPGLMLRGANTAASFIGNLMENKRQDQYMYNQLSTLGQLDAIPVENFQPKPYNLYASKGGSIRKYQTGGVTRGLIPQPNYPVTVTNKEDSLDYKYHFDDMVKRDPNAIYWANILRTTPHIPLTGDVDSSDIANFWHSHNELAAYEDALQPTNLMNNNQIAKELNTIYRPKDTVKRIRETGGEMKKGGWIQEATKDMRKDKPCTGSKFGGPSCRPGTKRYALAKTFRKMAKD